MEVNIEIRDSCESPAVIVLHILYLWAESPQKRYDGARTLGGLLYSRGDGPLKQLAVEELERIERDPDSSVDTRRAASTSLEQIKTASPPVNASRTAGEILAESQRSMGLE